jgi:hypothetical protein
MQGWCLAFIPFEKRVVGPNGEIGSHSRVARPLVYAHDACKADKTPPTSVNCSRARRHSRYARPGLIAWPSEKDPDAVVAVARYCADSATIRASTGTSRAAFVDR